MIDCIDATKDFALEDRTVNAKIAYVRLVHSSLYEGLLERIGILTVAEVREIKTYPNPQV